jgi:hypothetical protein
MSDRKFCRETFECFCPFWEELTRDTGAGPSLGYRERVLTAEEIDEKRPRPKTYSAPDVRSVPVVEVSEMAIIEEMSFRFRMPF